MCINSTRHAACRQKGISLIELVLFIVIVSVGIAGILSVMNVTTRASADPLQRKQALAVAEALLEEVSLLPFTDCDPDGLQANGSCTQPEILGPEPGESRTSLSTPFDNVNDYNGFALNGGGTDLGNSANVTVPDGYAAAVSVASDTNFGQGATVLPAVDALRITVTVAYGTDSIVLEGYRTRYAPAGTP